MGTQILHHKELLRESERKQMDVKQQRTRGWGKNKKGNREEDGLVGDKVPVTFIIIQLVAQRKINGYDL